MARTSGDRPIPPLRPAPGVNVTRALVLIAENVFQVMGGRRTGGAKRGGKGLGNKGKSRILKAAQTDTGSGKEDE